MNTNHSFYCKTCGYTYVGDKDSVQKAQDGHRGGCFMVRLPNGHLARPGLYESRMAFYKGRG